MSELYGPPVQRVPALELGTPRPEEHIGEIIDVETTSPGGADIEEWFTHRPTKVEEGVVNRYFEEIRSERDENHKFARMERYKKHFEEDPQGYFEQLIAAKKEESWQAELAEAQDLLSRLLTLIDQGEANIQQNLRGGLQLANQSGRSSIGEEAGVALSKFLEALTQGKIDNQTAKSQAMLSINDLLQTQLKAKTELLGANNQTRYDKLSPATQAFIWREFLKHEYAFDEGTDRRTATLRVLTEMRGPNSPHKVHEKRDRFVWQALQAGWDIQDQLKSEKDPQVRAQLEQQLRYHKSVARRWTSSIPGTVKDRFEDSPIPLNQAQNAAWARIKGTANRFRDPSPDGRTPGAAKKSWIRHGATYRKESWETQAMEIGIHVQFGTAWNAHRRLVNFTPDEETLVVHNYFEADYKTKPEKVKEEQHKKTTEKLEEQRKELDKLRDEREKLESIVSPTGKTAQEIARINSYLTRLETDLTSLDQEYQRQGVAPTNAGGGGGGGRQNQNNQQGQNAGGRLSFDKYEAQRSRMEKDRDKARERLETIDREQSEAHVKLDAVNRSLNELVAKYKWLEIYPQYLATPTTPPAPGSTPPRFQVDQAALDRRYAEALKKYYDEDEKKAKEKYKKLKEKLENFVNSDGYADFYDTFTPSEIKVIGELTGVGVALNKLTGKNTLAPGAIEMGVGELKVKERKLDAAGNPIIGADGEYEMVEKKIDEDYKADYTFFNPGAITPEWNGRLSVDATEQLLRNPDRYAKIKNYLDYIKDPNNNTITIEADFAVTMETDGGMTEAGAGNTGRGFDMEAAMRLKKLHGWKNIDLYKAWIENPRMQDEIGIRPDEMVTRMMADKARMHAWQRELLGEFTVMNILNTTAIPASDADDAPMYFEYMLMRQFDMFGRLSAEDVEDPAFYNWLPRTNETTNIYNKADGTREVHWRGEVITNNEDAPKTELDALFQALANQLDLYESRTRYYSTSRRPTGDQSYDDVLKAGAYIKAQMDLIALKKMRLRAVYENPDPNISMAERMQQLNHFREHEMNHLTYEILDARGKPKKHKNKELWQHYNATAQWLGKLKRNQRESENRLVATALNKNANVPGAGGISDLELAQTDYEYNKNERLRWEMEVYALGLEGLGHTQGLDNKEAAGLLARRYAGIKAEQMLRVEKKMYHAIRKKEEDIGNLEIVDWASQVMGTFATTAAADFGRRIALALNGIAQRAGVDLRLPADRFMLKLKPWQIEKLIKDKDDWQISKRLSHQLRNRFQTGAQANLWDTFDPATSDMVYKGAPDTGMDPTSKAIFNGYWQRHEEDFVDAIDRWFLMYGSEIFQDAKFSGMSIKEIFNTIENARMNDTTTAEVGMNGQNQLNPYGKKGNPMGVADYWVLNEALVLAGDNRRIKAMPEDNRFVRKLENSPSTIVQYYASL